MARWQKAWVVERPRWHRTKQKSYRVVYVDALTKRRKYPGEFETEAEATVYAKKLELWLNNAGPHPGGEQAGPADRHPWTETVDKWIESLGQCKDRTTRTMKACLARFAADKGVAFTEDVSADMIAGYLAAMRAAGKAKATIGHRLRTLRGFFRWLDPSEKRSPVTKDMLHVWKPYKLHRRARPHLFTDDEFDRMIGVCDAMKTRKGYRSGVWWKAFITLLYDCGVRLNEAAHLSWVDVDFDAGTIEIRPHVGIPGLLAWEPKGTSARTLPMSPRLAAALAARQAEQEPGVPYVFMSKDRYQHALKHGLGVRGDAVNGVRKGFVDIRKKVGIFEGTVHDMRRSFITRWARHPAMKVKDVQMLAGHADLKTTLDIYTMVDREDVVAKTRKLMQAPAHVPLSSPRPADDAA